TARGTRRHAPIWFCSNTRSQTAAPSLRTVEQSPSGMPIEPKSTALKTSSNRLLFNSGPGPTAQLFVVEKPENLFVRGTSHPLWNRTALIDCRVSQGERTRNVTEPPHHILACDSVRSPVRACDQHPLIRRQPGHDHLDQDLANPGAHGPRRLRDGLRSYQ